MGIVTVLSKYPEAWRWIPRGCLDEGCTITAWLHDDVVLHLVWVCHGEVGEVGGGVSEAARLFSVEELQRSDGPEDTGRMVREWLAQAHAYEVGEGPWK